MAKLPLAFALAKMDLGGYRHLPVVDGGRLVGGVGRGVVAGGEQQEREAGARHGGRVPRAAVKNMSGLGGTQARRGSGSVYKQRLRLSVRWKPSDKW